MTQFANAARNALGSNLKLSVKDIYKALAGTMYYDNKYIPQEVIEGTATEIYVPYTVTSIRSRCFWGLGACNIYIPGRVMEIASDAFLPTATLYCSFSEGTVSGAPWGAGKVFYDYKGI